MKIQLSFSKLSTIGLVLSFSTALHIHAFNYSVSFTGHGASTEVTSVLVQNISKGTSMTVAAGQSLNLTDGATSTPSVTAGNKGNIHFSNDANGNAFINFEAPKAGNTTISAFTLDGRKVSGITNDISEGNYRYKVSLPKGIYVVRVSGNGFYYHAKLVNPYDGGNGAQIVPDGVSGKEKSNASRVANAGVSMEYNEGDRIIFRGYSNNMCTLVSDVISADKTIDFNFVPCQDASGNHYATITIGDQVWMAENLKTTKYTDGTDIILRASKAEYLADPNSNTTPICRYFNDDANTKDVAGLAYKYQTIQKDLCPAGWHIPSHFEWRILRDAISSDTVDRYNAIRKTGPYWNNVGATNASGFSAVAGGTFWAEWPIHYGTWSIWLASDLWNNDPNNCWFFHAATDDNLTPGSIVCDEIASDAFAMFGAIRCLKNN